MHALPVPASLQNSLDTTKVEYFQLGSSGLRVSSPILWTMGIGSSKWYIGTFEEEEGVNILKEACDRGISRWDTANVYSSGVNAEVIGKALKKYTIPRENVVLLAKCMGTVPASPEIFSRAFEPQLQSKDYINNGGLSRGAIFKAFDASHKRLGTDYIDLLQIHRYGPTVSPPEETMKALHDLTSSGKVHYVGASSMWTYQFARLQFVAEENGWTKFVSVQNLYNLCYREEERKMNKFCKETGVGIIPWGPLGHGRLSKPLNIETLRSKVNNAIGSPVTEADREIIKRVEELTKKKACSMSQIALVWLRGKGCIPIVGLSSNRRSRTNHAMP